MKDARTKPGASRLIVLAGIVLSFVLGISLAGILFELGARWIIDDGMNYDLEMWKYAREIKRSSDDPEIGHVHRPNVFGQFMGVPVATNDAGYRDKDYPRVKSSGSIRIMMLGDSLTFGWGVEVSHTMADQLENILNRGAKVGSYEIINAGVGNYNTSMEVNSFIKGGSEFNPDIVILNYFINDAESTPTRKTNTIIEHSYGAVVLLSAVDSIARTYFGRPDWKSYYFNLYTDGMPGWEETQEAIRKLAIYCRRHTIRLMIAYLPELHELAPYPFTEITAKVRMQADKAGVPFVDLLPAVQEQIPQTIWVSPADAHPNAKADAIFAAQLAVALRKFFPEFFRDSD